MTSKIAGLYVIFDPTSHRSQHERSIFKSVLKKYVFYTSTKSADLLCISSFVFKIRPNNKRSTDSKLTCYLMYVFPSCVVQNYVIHVYFSGCPFHLMASYCYEYFRCRKVTYFQSAFQINVENCINFKSG